MKIALLCAAVCGISFLLTAVMLWLVCLCFGLPWSWQIALGMWVALAGIKAVFGRI